MHFDTALVFKNELKARLSACHLSWDDSTRFARFEAINVSHASSENDSRNLTSVLIEFNLDIS